MKIRNILVAGLLLMVPAAGFASSEITTPDGTEVLYLESNEFIQTGNLPGKRTSSTVKIGFFGF